MTMALVTDPNARAMAEVIRKKLEQILATLSDLDPS